jgi:hypothetical protein
MPSVAIKNISQVKKLALQLSTSFMRQRNLLQRPKSSAMRIKGYERLLKRRNAEEKEAGHYY